VTGERISTIFWGRTIRPFQAAWSADNPLAVSAIPGIEAMTGEPFPLIGWFLIFAGIGLVAVGLTWWGRR
jgi:hypothetical protein